MTQFGKRQHRPIEAADIASPYEAGRMDCIDGRTLSDNPYQHGTQAAYDYAMGYLDASTHILTSKAQRFAQRLRDSLS